MFINFLYEQLSILELRPRIIFVAIEIRDLEASQTPFLARPEHVTPPTQAGLPLFLASCSFSLSLVGCGERDPLRISETHRFYEQTTV